MAGPVSRITVSEQFAPTARRHCKAFDRARPVMAARVRICFAVLPALMGAGCAAPPQDYSPHYSYVATAPSSAKEPSRSVLVPDACLAEPADQVPEPAQTHMTFVPSLGPHLPPGCANVYNLQQMAVRERDLVVGRQLGPAPAAPSVRAARRYLDGEEPALGGAHNTDSATTPVP